jgi:hypothetical protein
LMIAAAVMSLLVLAASAKAESTTGSVVTAVGSVEESPVSAEPAAPPTPTETATPTTPVETPEPAEAVEAAEEAVNSTAESESAPVSRKLNATTPASTDQVEMAERTRHDAAKTPAPVRHSAKTAAQVVDQAAPPGRVRDLVRHPLQLGRDALQGGFIDLLASDRAETLLPPTEIAVGTHSHHAASRLPNALPMGAYLRHRATILNRILMQPLVEIGGVEPAWLGAPNAIGNLSRPSAVAARDSLASPDERSVSFPTFDGKVPLPSPTLPQATASGLGSSSFVPIVALLALLALAVPAIFRRLREAPAFSVPTPFVCALERPG